MGEKTKTNYVAMDVFFQGWFDNGSTTVRSHVSVRTHSIDEEGRMSPSESETVYSRNHEVFAGPASEAMLYAAANKAVTRYVEAMRLGDFAS